MLIYFAGTTILTEREVRLRRLFGGRRLYSFFFIQPGGLDSSVFEQVRYSLDRSSLGINRSHFSNEKQMGKTVV